MCLLNSLLWRPCAAELIEPPASVHPASRPPALDLAWQHGATPLFAASLNGHVEVLDLLITARADRCRCHQQGDTPLGLTLALEARAAHTTPPVLPYAIPPEYATPLSELAS